MKENITSTSDKICELPHIVFRQLKMKGTGRSAL
jgi:hypothetical protein